MMDLDLFDIADFHAHILPGVDHGSENLSTSLSQLAIAERNSVKRVLATPHFYPNTHTLSTFLELRDGAADELYKARKVSMPEFQVGAEVLICDGLHRFPDIDKLCFSGTKYLMLELPFFDFSESYAVTAGELVDMGYEVILAHADRYPENVIDTMLASGVEHLQINTDSLVGIFRKKNHIFRWIDEGLVCALGSDIHGTCGKAYRDFVKAQKSLGELLYLIKNASDKIWNEIETIK